MWPRSPWWTKLSSLRVTVRGVVAAVGGDLAGVLTSNLSEGGFRWGGLDRGPARPLQVGVTANCSPVAAAATVAPNGRDADIPSSVAPPDKDKIAESLRGQIVTAVRGVNSGTLSCGWQASGTSCGRHGDPRVGDRDHGAGEPDVGSDAIAAAARSGRRDHLTVHGDQSTNHERPVHSVDRSSAGCDRGGEVGLRQAT
jgi:hypothetical protein